MIKKFHAQTTRDALRQVRDALGANAIILSNRQVAGGVEIIAVADLDMAALTAQAEPALWAAHKPGRAEPAATASRARAAEPAISLEDAAPQIATLAEFLAQRETAGSPAAAGGLASRTPARAKNDLAPPGGGPDAFPGPGAQLIRPSPARQPRAAQPAAAAEAPTGPPDGALAAGVDELAREMRLLRGMVEGQLAGLAWQDLTRRDPMRIEALRRLLAAGFSAALAQQLLERLPAEEKDLQQALKWLRQTITRLIRVAAPEHDIIEQGGVYALVGPTGVGKTTTVAKLAARAVLRHGAARVALVTTDTYRIGAQDQLRIYGRILGTPVFAVRDENDLELTLSDLHSRHLVLIDTVGMSQRDKRVTEQVALLCGEGRQVSRLLLLGAPHQGVTLEEVARAYAGAGLIGAVLTKIDEAMTYGPVLDVAIRHELPLHFVTNGQRVPEDLHLANPTYLADRALRSHQTTDSPYTLSDGDYPVLMAANPARAAADTLAGGLPGAAG